LGETLLGETLLGETLFCELLPRLLKQKVSGNKVLLLKDFIFSRTFFWFSDFIGKRSGKKVEKLGTRNVYNHAKIGASHIYSTPCDIKNTDAHKKSFL